MNLKHKEHLNKFLLKTLYFISFLLGASSAFVLYIESDYFKTATGSENITYFYIIANLFALLIVFNWHHLLRTFGKSKVYLFALAVKGIVILLLSLLSISRLSAWLLAFYMILTLLTWLDIDILLETCSIDKVTGKIRGMFMTIVSAGYLISPIFAGYLVSRYGFQSAFAVAFLIILVIFSISIWQLRNINHYHPRRIGFLELLSKVWKRKNVLRAYYLSFLLEFFYALMIIYTPLYLLNLGFSWTEIGKMFTIMLVPFVIIQYPVGILVDRYFEERDLLKIAIVITAVATAAIFFISSKNFFVWAMALLGTRIGASLFDVLKESYFFKRVDQRDVDIVNFFRTVRPMAYIIGPLIATPVVIFLHIKFIFPIIGLGVLTGFWAAKNLASSRIPPVVNESKI